SSTLEDSPGTLEDSPSTLVDSPSTLVDSPSTLKTVAAKHLGVSHRAPYLIVTEHPRNRDVIPSFACTQSFWRCIRGFAGWHYSAVSPPRLRSPATLLPADRRARRQQARLIASA